MNGCDFRRRTWWLLRVIRSNVDGFVKWVRYDFTRGTWWLRRVIRSSLDGFVKWVRYDFRRQVLNLYQLALCDVCEAALAVIIWHLWSIRTVKKSLRNFVQSLFETKKCCCTQPSKDTNRTKYRVTLRLQWPKSERRGKQKRTRHVVHAQTELNSVLSMHKQNQIPCHT